MILTHGRTGNTLYNVQPLLKDGDYKILIPKGAHTWRVSVEPFKVNEPGTALIALDAPPVGPGTPVGPDTRKTLERLWAGETLSFYSPPESGALTISTPESTSTFRADRDRWMYLHLDFPGVETLNWQSRIELHTEPAPAQNKIKAMLVGDSVLYGYLDTLPSKRLPDHPQLVLNREQQVFDFCYNYATPGASFAGMLSADQATRAANGMPGGCTLAQLLAQTDAQAVLFNLGGNDHVNRSALPDSVKTVAQTCQAAGKIFAFVGVIDINALCAYSYSPAGSSFYTSGYLTIVAEIAAAAELLRQTCRAEGYPFVDLRSGVMPDPWSTITGDVIHPTQHYSTSIFTHVAKSIAA